MEFHAPPGVMKGPDGKQYIVGINPIVPYTAKKLEELKEEYANRVKHHEELVQSLTTQSFEVPSNSDPNKKYTVTVYTSGKMECSCTGYSFRRKCSHIEKVKGQLKNG